MMKMALYCLVLAVGFLHPLSARAQEDATSHSRLAFLKPRPLRVLHFVGHHKTFLINSTVLVAADAAYTRSLVDMRHRCPQCVGEGNPGAAAAGIGLFIAANYYVTTKVPEHRIANYTALSILTGNAAYWLGRAAYGYSSVDNLNDLNNLSILDVRRRGFILPSRDNLSYFPKVPSYRR